MRIGSKILMVAMPLMMLSQLSFAHRYGYDDDDQDRFLSRAPVGSRILLGETHLTDRLDVDVMTLPRCRGSLNRFVGQVQLSVKKAHADISRVVVWFQNGERQEIKVRKNFAPGSKSRWIDLRGGQRCIKTIRIVGDTDIRNGHRGQAKISIYGR